MEMTTRKYIQCSRIAQRAVQGADYSVLSHHHSWPLDLLLRTDGEGSNGYHCAFYYDAKCIRFRGENRGRWSSPVQTAGIPWLRCTSWGRMGSRKKQWGRAAKGFYGDEDDEALR